MKKSEKKLTKVEIKELKKIFKEAAEMLEKSVKKENRWLKRKE